MSELQKKSNITKNQLTITKLNGLASIQDLGRINSQCLGFSAGGAADEYAFLAANALLNNNNDCATLEVTLGQIHLQANSDCIIALTGADCQAVILSLSGKQSSIKNWQYHQLKQGDILQLHRPAKMLHSYIAIKGGIQSKLWLNSRSQTFNELALGFTDKQLQVGEGLPFSLAATTDKSLVRSEQKTNHSKVLPKNFYCQQDLTLRFLPSDLYLSLTLYRQQEFIKQNYNILSESNRMGYRLNGMTPLIHEQPQAGLSKPVSYGTIQLPSNGQPIVLMKERQTIGGYPVLGTVMQTDLFRLSQRRPGESVNFIPVTIEQAQAQLSAFYQRF